MDWKLGRRHCCIVVIGSTFKLASCLLLAFDRVASLTYQFFKHGRWHLQVFRARSQLEQFIHYIPLTLYHIFIQSLKFLCIIPLYYVLSVPFLLRGQSFGFGVLSGCDIYQRKGLGLLFTFFFFFFPFFYPLRAQHSHTTPISGTVIVGFSECKNRLPLLY